MENIHLHNIFCPVYYLQPIHHRYNGRIGSPNPLLDPYYAKNYSNRNKIKKFQQKRYNVLKSILYWKNIKQGSEYPYLHLNYKDSINYHLEICLKDSLNNINKELNKLAG